MSDESGGTVNYVFEIVYTDKDGVLGKRHGTVVTGNDCTKDTLAEMCDLVTLLLRSGAKDLRLNMLSEEVNDI